VGGHHKGEKGGEIKGGGGGYKRYKRRWGLGKGEKRSTITPEGDQILEEGTDEKNDARSLTVGGTKELTYLEKCKTKTRRCVRKKLGTDTERKKRVAWGLKKRRTIKEEGKRNHTQPNKKTSIPLERGGKGYFARGGDRDRGEKKGIVFVPTTRNDS